jgi:hypothetical protein
MQGYIINAVEAVFKQPKNHLLTQTESAAHEKSSFFQFVLYQHRCCSSRSGMLGARVPWLRGTIWRWQSVNRGASSSSISAALSHAKLQARQVPLTYRWFTYYLEGYSIEIHNLLNTQQNLFSLEKFYGPEITVKTNLKPRLLNGLFFNGSMMCVFLEIRTTFLNII